MGKKPEWLRIKVRNNASLAHVEDILRKFSLNTVCDEANCPNRMECFSKQTATFMILGKNCTRNCTFCNVSKGKPEDVNPNEPMNVARASEKLGLRHVVITSVTRDDLSDGGASHFAKVITELRKNTPDTKIEVLIPDFQGDYNALSIVVKARPEIINHNVETVPSLYPEVRPMALYKRSLELLKRVKEMDNGIYTKSGIMLGLGETQEEVYMVLKDLRTAGCNFLTIGQYLAPSHEHHRVVEYIHPDTFAQYKKEALEIGFNYVASGPFVRSSYNAEEAINNIQK